MSDLNIDRLEALAKDAQSSGRGGSTPVTIPAADLLALINRTRKFANMLANYGNAINATLPAEVVRQKAEAWDEGHHAGHEDARAVQPTYPDLTPNPYRTSTPTERGRP